MIEILASNYKEKYSSREILGVDTFPPLFSLPRTYLGSFAWTNSTHRYLNNTFAVPVEDTLWTPADMARGYLEYRYGEQKRRTSTQAYRDCFCPKHKPHPLFAEPTLSDRELVYVDLKAAYWNILLRVGWDVDYSPNRYLGVRSDNSDFPFPNNKLARNILVSAGLPSKVSVWTGKRLIVIKGRNKLYNGILWCCVQDVLHSIAQDMIDAGAIYVHTDGYIFPSRLVGRAFEIAKAWGLELSTKYYGRGWVGGLGLYYIEGMDTERPRKTSKQTKYKIQPTTRRDWLRNRIKQLERP